MNKISVDPKAKALIFDIDGTLVDSMPLHYKAWVLVGDKYGFTFGKQLFYELAGVPTPQIARVVQDRYRVSTPIQVLSDEKENTYVSLIDQIKPLQPVVNVALAYFGKLPMAAGTGSPRENAIKTLETIDLQDIFDVIVTYEDVENPKPAPDTFLLCAEKLKVKPSDCQVFEDGDPGIEAAFKAGMMVTDIKNYI